MDIKQLRYFVGIADSGSLMKASERLHVAQPALSVQLGNLESELGVALMQRNSRGVELTAEGRELYDRATTILKYHRETIESIKGRQTRTSGTVSLGIPSSASPMLAPLLYRRVRKELPNISLYITDASTASLYEWLLEGRLDLSILFSLPEDTPCEVIPLQVEEFCLVGRHDGKPYEPTIDFERLFDHPLVMPCRSSTWRKILDDVAERFGRRLESPMETESASVMKAVAMSGQAFCLLPASCVEEEKTQGLFRVQRVINPEFRGVLSLAASTTAVAHPARRAVRDLVVDVVKQQGASMSDLDAGDLSSATPVLRAVPGRVPPASK
jgi:LysR family nitrogen assimilation transcriptional regulator